MISLPHSTQEIQCPLFQDPEEDVIACEGVSEGAGVDGRVLKPGDPYYEMKLEKFIKKVLYYHQLHLKLCEWILTSAFLSQLFQQFCLETIY